MEVCKFLIVVVCLATVFAEDTLGPTTIHEIPIGPVRTTNEHSTSTKSTPTTPPTPPTPPTTKPTTTTTPTTTTAPTTTAKPTTTTKSTTTATTTVKPTPTTAPPNTKPEVGTWNVTKPGTNVTCIVAKMAIQIEIVHNATHKDDLNVPKEATANGTCDEKTQMLTITWNTTKNDVDTVSFRFTKNSTTSEVKLDYLNVVINSNKSVLNFAYNRTEFEVPLKHSYKCNKEQVLNLTKTPTMKENCTALLKVSQVQIQAFRNSSSTGFDDAIDCLNSTPDIVPIAVGCALAALVVIVLLAYLYGRRRSQARGYLSM